MKQSAEDFVSLLKDLSSIHARIVELTRGLSHPEFCKRTPEESFSALENICHLRDLEMQAYTPRIERILSETNPVLADFDGARVAAQSDYNGEEPHHALEAFSLAREQNIQNLKALSEEQLEREGLFEGVGRITLRRLAEMMREHDEGHLEDLRVLRQQIENQRKAAMV